MWTIHQGSHLLVLTKVVINLKSHSRNENNTTSLQLLNIHNDLPSEEDHGTNQGWQRNAYEIKVILIRGSPWYRIWKMQARNSKVENEDSSNKSLRGWLKTFNQIFRRVRIKLFSRTSQGCLKCQTFNTQFSKRSHQSKVSSKIKIHSTPLTTKLQILRYQSEKESETSFLTRSNIRNFTKNLYNLKSMLTTNLRLQRSTSQNFLKVQLQGHRINLNSNLWQYLN